MFDQTGFMDKLSGSGLLEQLMMRYRGADQSQMGAPTKPGVPMDKPTFGGMMGGGGVGQSELSGAGGLLGKLGSMLGRGPGGFGSGGSQMQALPWTHPTDRLGGGGMQFMPMPDSGDDMTGGRWLGGDMMRRMKPMVEQLKPSTGGSQPVGGATMPSQPLKMERQQ